MKRCIEPVRATFGTTPVPCGWYRPAEKPRCPFESEHIIAAGQAPAPSSGQV